MCTLGRESESKRTRERKKKGGKERLVTKFTQIPFTPNESSPYPAKTSEFYRLILNIL